ncbi:VOC family protein [Luteimonas sp. R10]|uniref:VOC family protein n=1 Tax=Luteimonas sp. R10 TaxID=3108176 RepID=UPI00308E60BF|nr:VOC family protein [Luteimonas sp. R10]
MAAQTRSLVSFAHVASVERSIEFYADLGFKVANTVVPEGRSSPVWAWLESDKANLMVGLASGPIDASQQAVLFYLYFDDIKQTRAALSERGHSPGEIKYPFYMPGGEFRLEDPDGYVLMLAQIQAAS